MAEVFADSATAAGCLARTWDADHPSVPSALALVKQACRRRVSWVQDCGHQCLQGDKSLRLTQARLVPLSGQELGFGDLLTPPNQRTPDSAGAVLLARQCHALL